jgi:hypothetical protein
MHGLHAYINTYIQCVCIYIQCVCIYMQCVCIYIQCVCVYIHTRVCMYVCMYIWIYIHVHVCTHAYACTHEHLYAGAICTYSRMLRMSAGVANVTRLSVAIVFKCTAANRKPYRMCSPKSHRWCGRERFWRRSWSHLTANHKSARRQPPSIYSMQSS